MSPAPEEVIPSDDDDDGCLAGVLKAACCSSEALHTSPPPVANLCQGQLIFKGCGGRRGGGGGGADIKVCPSSVATELQWRGQVSIFYWVNSSPTDVSLPASLSCPVKSAAKSKPPA